MRVLRVPLLAGLLGAACTGTLGESLDPDDGAIEFTVDADAPDAGPLGEPDAGRLGELDAGPPPDADAGPEATIAPDGFVPEAAPADDGDNPVELGEGQAAWFRIEVEPNEHVGLFLWFEPSGADVVMRVHRFTNGERPELGYTDGGGGIRTLALYEGTRPARTYYVSLEAAEAFTGRLEVVRTPFEDGPRCTGDCAHLLQLPLPVDGAVDGYGWNPSIVMRYQFGRRDLVMFFRYAAARMAATGHQPFIAGDFSQWDGATPGEDVGALRHLSHQRGKDVDITLYGTDGESFWRSYCEVQYDSDPAGGTGRECVPGTVDGYDARANAEMFGHLFTSGRVTISFLDRELAPPTYRGAEEAIAAGALDPSLSGALSSSGLLSHWPNHDNHIHVRVSEEPYDAPGTLAFDLSPP